MNDLSWFLYLADIFPRMSTLGAITATVTLMAAVPLFGFSVMSWNVNFAKTAFKWCVGVFVIGVILAVFVPSKDTIYLIAASEAGEMVVKTPEAQEVISDLKEILKIQLEKLKN